MNAEISETIRARLLRFGAQIPELLTHHRVKVSSHCDQVSPPLHTPLGSVAHPQPWPQGRAQASEAFESGFLLRMATAASLFTSGSWVCLYTFVVIAEEQRWCLLPLAPWDAALRCFTSDWVAAALGNTIEVHEVG